MDAGGTRGYVDGSSATAPRRRHERPLPPRRARIYLQAHVLLQQIGATPGPEVIALS